jgi:hypothetical protein
VRGTSEAAQRPSGRDHFVFLGDDDRGDEGQSVLALVGDQDGRCSVSRQLISGSGGAASRACAGCTMCVRFVLSHVSYDRYLRFVLPSFGIALAISLVFVAFGAVLG